jgi:hypothetical protein
MECLLNRSAPSEGQGRRKVLLMSSFMNEHTTKNTKVERIVRMSAAGKYGLPEIVSCGTNLL